MRRKRQVRDEIYQQLAVLSGGQFLNVRTSEISELASLVSFSAVRSRRTIFRRSDVLFGEVEYSFPVDSSVVQATISINGQGINVNVSTPQGLSPDNLTEYSISLLSATSYISQVNVTSNLLRGEWRVMIQSQGFYTIQVFGSSELTFTEYLYNVDSSSISGFREVEGRPTQGNSLAVLIEIEGVVPVTATTLNFIGSGGNILLSTNNLTAFSGNEYVAIFAPPSEPFTLQLVGVDQNGFNFSHISDTSVEITAIDLALGTKESKIFTMRPKDRRNVTLVLQNQGEEANFSITVNTAMAGANDTNSNATFFEYILTPSNVFLLDRGSSMEVKIEITVSSHITDGLMVDFTVIAESVLDTDISDFSTFTMFTTTRPPPEFTENLVAESGVKVATPPTMLMEVTMVIMGYFLLC